MPSIIRSSKIVILASDFTYFRLPAPAMTKASQGPKTKNVCKTRGWNYTFEFLMMSGVSPETCWAIKKCWNNKFYYKVASCWFFLWDLYYVTRIHEHQVISEFGTYIPMQHQNITLLQFCSGINIRSSQPTAFKSLYIACVSTSFSRLSPLFMILLNIKVLIYRFHNVLKSVSCILLPIIFHCDVK
jgi:hypothetical protein